MCRRLGVRGGWEGEGSGEGTWVAGRTAMEGTRGVGTIGGIVGALKGHCGGHVGLRQRGGGGLGRKRKGQGNGEWRKDWGRVWGWACGGGGVEPGSVGHVQLQTSCKLVAN